MPCPRPEPKVVMEEINNIINEIISESDIKEKILFIHKNGNLAQQEFACKIISKFSRNQTFTEKDLKKINKVYKEAQAFAQYALVCTDSSEFQF